MDASRYKDYMLGLMFYKFLSDKTLMLFRDTFCDKEQTLMEAFEIYRSFPADDLAIVYEHIQNALKFYVPAEYLYQSWIKDINDGAFELEKVSQSLAAFERLFASEEDSSNPPFKNLFSGSKLDLSDTALGSNLNERSRNIKSLILLFADLNMAELQEGDVLGNAYEYLIGMFAMESGKKAGEFYTPRQVSEVMAQIVTRSTLIQSVYDPTVGSGSLLLTVGRHLNEDDRLSLRYYGQEKNTATYNLTRMNLLLHGVSPDNMDIHNGDTLAEDWPEDPARPGEGIQFDAVVMNPPYSLKNWNKNELKVSDPRFEVAGVLPPDSKGDFAFLLHGLYHLGQKGTMAIVLPHGVLFRGAAEGEIRKRLLDKNYIDAVIGMPANLFTNTGIPVVVIILKKDRPIGAPLLIIDASKDFIKVGKQNALREKDIARIVDTFLSREETPGYSHLASREEIIENDYNLNIPRYVASIDQEVPHDVDAHLYGGIPEQNIKDLKVLQSIVPDILAKHLKPLHPGYLKLATSLEALSEDIFNSDIILSRTDDLRAAAEVYINKYWDLLRLDKDRDHVKDLMNTMLEEIKLILEDFRFIDVYDGYQIIAEIWTNSLSHDMELITASNFYDVARSREPNMVTKGSGSKRREEQEGWVGAIIPNELIIKQLYADESAAIDDMESQVAELESELADLAEAAKVEDSDENTALFESLKKDNEGEPLDTFDFKVLRQELKAAPRKSPEWALLNKVNNLDTDISRLKKEAKEAAANLTTAAQERILKLTNEEADALVYEKWFGSTVDELAGLITAPVKEELDVIDMLNKRYESTISDLDDEIARLEKELEAMMSELVVVL